MCDGTFTHHPQERAVGVLSRDEHGRAEGPHRPIHGIGVHEPRQTLRHHLAGDGAPIEVLVLRRLAPRPARAHKHAQVACISTNLRTPKNSIYRPCNCPSRISRPLPRSLLSCTGALHSTRPALFPPSAATNPQFNQPHQALRQMRAHSSRGRKVERERSTCLYTCLALPCHTLEAVRIRKSEQTVGDACPPVH